MGEKLNCREDDCKEAKQHDEYAIGTYLEACTGTELVGHVPMELSYLINTFLRAYDDNEVSAKVTRRVKNIQSADTKQGYCHEVGAGDFAAERLMNLMNLMNLPGDLFSQLVKLWWLQVKILPHLKFFSSLKRLTFNQSLVNIRLIVISSR